MVSGLSPCLHKANG